MIVGVISDTHDLLRSEAVDALRGVEAIIHAGDVGDPLILDVLREIAPVTAVRGNVDRGALARDLPGTAVVDCAGVLVFVIHNLADLDLNPRIAGFGVVVSGHTHEPVVRMRDGVLYLNPGSAGPRRFKLPIAVAKLTIKDGVPSANIIQLDV